MGLPPRLLGAVGTSAAQEQCNFSYCIRFSMFWKCLSKFSIDFEYFKAISHCNTITDIPSRPGDSGWLTAKSSEKNDGRGVHVIPFFHDLRI